MKEGYIVWNNSNCGPEFFGIYKNHKQAKRQLKKVIRNRYGRCPRDLDNFDSKKYPEINNPSEDDSYTISWFRENDGNLEEEEQ